MKKNDGILLGQPDELMEMLFFNIYQGTINVKTLTHHLFYLLDGTLTLLYQGKKYLLSTNDIFFIPVEEVIILSSKQCHALTLVIPPSRFSSSNPHIYCNSALFPNPHYDTLRRLLAALLPLLSAASAYGREETKTAFRDISIFLSKYFHAPEAPATSLQPEAIPFSQNKHQIFLKNVLQEINTSYTKRITLSSLARQYYVSTSYLSKLFLKETGLHFNDYILNLRLSDAMSQVIFSNYSLSEIAHHSGFPDTRSLHDAFSKANGIGPAEYRKQLKKQADSSEKTAAAVKRLTGEGYFQELLPYLDSTLPKTTSAHQQKFPSLTAESPDCHYRLSFSTTAAQTITRHFSLLFSDWRLLLTESVQNSLRRLKQEACLEAVALLLPVQSEGLLSVFDFLYQEQLTVFLLSSPAPSAGAKTRPSTTSQASGQTKDKPGIAKADMIAALQQRYQNKLTVMNQEIQDYAKQSFQISPFSKEAALIHDSYPSASLLLEQLARGIQRSSARSLPEESPSFCYYYTDPSDLCYPPSSPSPTREQTYSGRPGLFTAGGIAKPSFYAFCFFSRLGPEILSQEDGILIARKENRIQILLYQASASLPAPHAAIPPSDTLPLAASLKELSSSLPSRKLSIRLEGFSYSYAMLTEQRLSPDKHSGLEGWLSLSPPDKLDNPVCSSASAVPDSSLLPYKLEKHLEPLPTLQKHVLPVKENTLLLEYELLPYEVCLLELEGGYLAR